MSVNLREIKSRLRDLQKIYEYKKTAVLCKLNYLINNLETLYSSKSNDSSFNSITLRYDITVLKDMTKLYDENPRCLRKEDFEKINEIYKQYKKYIKNYDNTI